MYQTRTVIVKRQWKDLFDYCRKSCEDAKLMKNTVIFRCRQIISADGKDYDKLFDLEKQVLEEFELTDSKKNGRKLYLPNYYTFDKMFRKTGNPDFFNSLPMQTSQNIIKSVLSDFKSFFKAVKDYSLHPEKYNAKPNLPKYIKNSQAAFDITNQDAVIKHNKNASFMKLPKTKATVPLGDMKTGRLKELTITPFYDTYKICIVMDMETDTVPCKNNGRFIGIDLGVSNFAAVNNNCGLTPFIINGRMLKSYNQWYNRELSKLRSFVMKEGTGRYSSKRIQRLNKDHYNKTNDFYNKAASYIIGYCIKNDISVIVVGKNDGWKQDVDMGKKNNQTFCHIAHTGFINKLKTLASRYNISVITTEESYTSKADLLSLNDMDSYTVFSGNRIMRGLYKSGTGKFINADINGAGNIIRKIFKDAFNGINMSYMTYTVNMVNI